MRAATALAALAAVAACTPDTSSSDESADTPAVISGTVAVPIDRLSPFCESMVALADRLASDPPEDETAFIIDTYRAITPEVPAEIANDFAAVLARLEGRPIPTVDPDDTTPLTDPAPAADSTDTSEPAAAPLVTTASSDTLSPVTAPPATDADGSPIPQDTTFSDEGYAPEEDPAERLNAYVNFVCRDSQNNPGPPATQPLDDIAVTSTSG